MVKHFAKDSIRESTCPDSRKDASRNSFQIREKSDRGNGPGLNPVQKPNPLMSSGFHFVFPFFFFLFSHVSTVSSSFFLSFSFQ